MKMDLLLTLEDLYCVDHQFPKKQTDIRTHVDQLKRGN